MEIVKKAFPKVIKDNDSVYFAHLKGVIESVDEYSSLQITANRYSYHFRLAPSHPMYNDILLQEILNFHNRFKIKLDLSKSIKTSGVINFKIKLKLYD